MRRLWMVGVFLVVGMALGGLPGAAVRSAAITGGGTGTFGADIDGDGRVDGSQFGLGVILSSDGSARGHFECLMAGRSEILGLSLMSVAGRVADATMNADGTVTLRGTATVNLGNGQMFRDVPYEVVVTGGGPAIGGMKLSVIGAFDGVPGDTVPGNGNYDLPQEHVASGEIQITS